MPKIKSSSEPVVLEGSFKTWTMDKASEILVSEKYDGAIEDMIGSSHNILNIFGHVQNTDMFGGTALTLDGDEIELRIGKSGLVQGTTTGMYLSGDGSLIHNSGRIEGGFGLYYAAVTGARVINEKGARITADDEANNSGNPPAIYADALSGGFKLTNHGLVAGVNASTAIELEAGDDRIINDGKINGAINMGSGIDRITNRREIIGAISFTDGNGDVVVNSGTIAFGITFGSGDDTLRNSGNIGTGVNFGSGHDTLKNSGTIAGDVFFDGGTNTTHINTGRIEGNVTLGAGSDVFDARKGVVEGTLEGFLGNDTIIVDKASKQLSEVKDYMNGQISGGFDTVKSTVSYELNLYVEQLILLGKKNLHGTGTGEGNTLTGNSGDNLIKGLGGEDIIAGGKGNDKLFGGFDKDTFRFATGDGNDVIADFRQNGDDVIDVSRWKGLDDMNDILRHADGTRGGDVVISVGKDSITILGMHENQLAQSDFVFEV